MKNLHALSDRGITVLLVEHRMNLVLKYVEKIGSKVLVYLVLVLVLVLVLAMAPLYLPQSWITYLFLCFIFLSISEAWSFLARLTGLIFLGVHGVTGFSSYMFAILSAKMNLPMWCAFPLTVLFSNLLFCGLSPLIFRMKGMYFALATFLLTYFLKEFFVLWQYAGGALGIYITYNLSLNDVYFLGLSIAVFSICFLRALSKSNMKLVLSAIGDDEEAAMALGIDVFRVKFIGLLIGTCIISSATIPYYLYMPYISPEGAFSFSWMSYPLTIAITGGSGVMGPIIATPIIVYLWRTFLLLYPEISMILQGLVLIFIGVAFPEGMKGALDFLKDKPARKRESLKVLSMS